MSDNTIKNEVQVTDSFIISPNDKKSPTQQSVEKLKIMSVLLEEKFYEHITVRIGKNSKKKLYLKSLIRRIFKKFSASNQPKCLFSMEIR